MDVLHRDRAVTFAAALCLALGCVPPAAAQSSDADRYWGQWRGPEATGVARHADPPLTWSETEHVAWKVEVPGRGSASPIVWGDKVFLLTAVPFGDRVPLAAAEVARGRRSAEVSPRGAPERRERRGRGGGRGNRRGRGGPRGAQEVQAHRFTVLAFDRETGDVVWERVAREALPHEGYQQPNGSYAAGSAVTDGERLYAFFGSWGLYAYDLDGELLWESTSATGSCATRSARGRRRRCTATRWW